VRAVKIGNENYPLIARTQKLQALHGDARFGELLEELRRGWEARRHGAEAA
jgi:hypothetical protein